MIVLDTNVVSELMRPLPAAAVLTWWGDQPLGSLTTTAVTAAEIRFGLARLPDGRRSVKLRQIAEEILGSFPQQVLPFDVTAVGWYGGVAAQRERAGSPIAALDGQIAAICRSRQASLATRNTRHFIDTGVELIDPWEA